LFEGLIEKYLLENEHRTTVLLEPDPALLSREEQEERERLDQAAARFSQAELEELARRTEDLQRIQATPDSPEDLAKLPFLKLEDLEKENTPIP